MFNIKTIKRIEVNLTILEVRSPGLHQISNYLV